VTVYTDFTRAGDTATQGCDRSIDSAAGKARSGSSRSASHTDEGAIAGAGFLPFGDEAQAFICAANGTVNIVGPGSNFTGGDTWVIGIDRLGGHVVGHVNNINFDNFVITTHGYTQTATGTLKAIPPLLSRALRGEIMHPFLA
jgi:hypothetical protein